jgi:hypothetical protein
VTPTYLAMIWRYADGSFTAGFWSAGSIALLMVIGGIWGLVSPESFRAFYFNIQRKLHGLLGDRNPSEAPRPGWGWGSPTSIRLSSLLAIGLGAGFMTWVLLVTVPGHPY